jgi:asparagine synthase (glutamine-hydrolysing)
MCGIVGCYPAQELTQISDSLLTIAHRGPDEKGFFEIPRGTLGHVRLSILDVAGGHQPMADRESFIVFNGEIYNYRQLAERLPESVNTDSDTEVILKLYSAFGPKCIDLLDGMFAFAIINRDGLFLARDPLGIKPLYYAQNGGSTWFASELKALSNHAADVREFPPGHWWHSQHGLHRFYDLDELPGSERRSWNQDYDSTLSTIQERLRQSVHKRLIADDDVPVGVSLSGGLDSSIVAALAREAKNMLDTFVVGTGDSRDIAASQQVADYLGTHHHVYSYTFEEMLDSLPEVIYYLESFDAPLVRSAVPNYFLAKLAAEHVKVILLGEGADELLAGYAYLAAIDDPQALDKELRLITQKLHNTNLQRADRMTMSQSIEGRVPFLDEQVIETMFSLPAEWKLQRENHPEKELLRRSVAGLLPDEIVWRPKLKFSDGAGSMNMLVDYADRKISDEEYARHRRTPGSPPIRSKEELLYYYIFKETFGDELSPDVVGSTRSITREELV